MSVWSCPDPAEVVSRMLSPGSRVMHQTGLVKAILFPSFPHLNLFKSSKSINPTPFARALCIQWSVSVAGHCRGTSCGLWALSGRHLACLSSSSQGSTATNLAPIFNITREKSSSGKAESHIYPSVHLLLLWLDRKIP